MAITTFLGILIYYKYYGFIIDNLIYAGVKGVHQIKMASSIGLSFFTFQAISYNIDVYRKNKYFEKNPANVMLYLTMFPQLILGPLVRYHLIEQQLKSRKIEFVKFTEGIKRFIIGLAKKVLVANQIGYLIDRIMDTDLKMISPAVAWVGMLTFAIQLLFDFSGYTDMAIGVGKMLGFDLPENFNYPYISRSITEFWRRWHLTLSSWIKDYIFNPLAMSMRYWGRAGIFIALIITFLICGIWHGPKWNYALWGVAHGLFLGLEELFMLKYIKRLKFFGLFYTWFILIICGVLFRTIDLNQSAEYYSVMFNFTKTGGLGLNCFFMNEHTLILILGMVFCIPISIPKKFKTGRRGDIIQIVGVVLLVILFLLSIMRLVADTNNPFLYFKF